MADSKGRPPLKPIPMPIELAAMKGRLVRATEAEKGLAVTGKAYDEVLDSIDAKHDLVKDHVGHLRRYDGELGAVIDRITGGSNGAPEDDEEEADRKDPPTEALHAGQSTAGDGGKVEAEPPKPEPEQAADGEAEKPEGDTRASSFSALHPSQRRPPGT